MGTPSSFPDSDTSAAGRRTGFGALLRGAALILLVSVLALLAAGAAYQSIATTFDARAYPAPGQRVDVGGYRLHLSCAGEGSPTVILDGASVDTVSDWAWIQPRIAEVTRVCAYDRAGLGWSDGGTPPRDAKHNAEQLHSLLQQGGVPGPYVLVGHSLGGLYTRMYAADYPTDVVGMVLIEATHPDFLARQDKPDVLPDADETMLNLAPFVSRFGLLRLFSFVPIDQALPLRQQAELRSYYASAKFADAIKALYDAFPTILAQVRATGSLGDMPLAVIVGGASESSSGYLLDLQHELAALSTDSTVRTIESATIRRWCAIAIMRKRPVRRSC